MKVKDKKPTVKVTIYPEPETWRSLRIHAVREGTSANAIVTKLIEDYLRKVERKGGNR